MTEELYQEMYGEFALLKAKVEALFYIAEKTISRHEIEHEIETALHFGMMNQTAKLMNEQQPVKNDQEKVNCIWRQIES